MVREEQGIRQERPDPARLEWMDPSGGSLTDPALSGAAQSWAFLQLSDHFRSTGSS